MSADRTCPTAPGATVGRRRRRIEDGSAGETLSQAVEFFNRSEAARVVAGLTRTLGQPRVSIGAAAGSRSEVRITVAWELSWYQWAVELDAPRGSSGVSQLAKGGELIELDGSARMWNGGVAKGGVLYLGRPPRRALRRRRLW